MSTVKLTPEQWKTIRSLLHEEHPRTVFMLRNKMKQVLGFTVREHSCWVDAERIEDFHNGQEGWYMGKKHEFQIHLDFYNERKYTMFLMKFSEHISRKNNNDTK